MRHLKNDYLILFATFAALLLISKAVDAHDSDLLLKAIARQESLCGIHLYGKNGELGTYQIKPTTARWRGFSDDSSFLLNPLYNYLIAKDIIDYLLKKYQGNIYKTLGAYNLGIRGLKESKVAPKDLPYVKLILGHLKKKNICQNLY